LNDPTVSLNDIFAGALPFAVIMILVLLLIVAVPWLSLALV
jgi:TRAP-type mannitol/chloroaromatic compound transport system permease large subunit